MRRMCSVILAGLMITAVTFTGAYAADMASISVSGMPLCMTPGETRTVPVSVTNTGGVSWTSGTYMVSYHWEGPISIWDGIRTDLNETMKSQVVNAQLKAGNHQTGANLPAGAYTLKWQVLHKNSGWIQQEKAYPVEVKESCLVFTPIVVELLNTNSIASLCQILDCGSLTAPKISRLVTSQVTQGALILLMGRNFGEGTGEVWMSGKFGADGSTKSVKLDIWNNDWYDDHVSVRLPENVVGFDQDVTLQVKPRKGASSNEWKAKFVTQLDYKPLPRSAMKITNCGQQGGNNYCNDGPSANWYPDSAVVGRHSKNCESRSGSDGWSGDIKNGWKYDSMVLNSWGGSAVPNQFTDWGNSISFWVDWNSPGREGWDCFSDVTGVASQVVLPGYCYALGYNEGTCMGEVGYWIDITVKGPMGMEY